MNPTKATSPITPCFASHRNHLSNTTVHEGISGAGGRPLRPKTVTTKPFRFHITRWIFQSIAG